MNQLWILDKEDVVEEGDREGEGDISQHIIFQ